MTTLLPLFSDRPVDNDTDCLWRGDEIRTHIEQLAHTFTEPLRRGRPASSLTVAIQGPWGSGKSSALALLQDLTLAKARELSTSVSSPGEPSPAVSPADPAAAPAPQTTSERVVFCKYSAPILESTHRDPRTTLVARMLVSLAGGVQEAVSDLFLQARAVSAKLGDGPGIRSAEAQQAWSAATLMEIAETLSQLHDFDAWLGNRISRRDEPRVLIVLIDDLDNCEPSFVGRLLVEVQELGGLKNLFFALAADESTLRRAVRDRVPGRQLSDIEIEHELTKLVQHAIHVPSLTLAGTKSLLDYLLGDRARSDDPVARTLLANVDLIFQGLPEPTPRSVKRCLNALSRDLRAVENASDRTASDDRKALKEALVRHTWPAFHSTYFKPMSASPGRERDALFYLQGILCQARERSESESDIDRRIAHELAFLCGEHPHLSWGDLPIRLVRFLGEEPPLLATEPELSVVQAPRTRALGRVTRGGRRGARPGAPGRPQADPRDDVPPPDAGIGPDGDEGERGEVKGLPADLSSPSGVLDVALKDISALPNQSARLERAVAAMWELLPFEPESDGLSATLARGLLPLLERSAAHADAYLCVLDRYVTLLRRASQHRTLGEALHNAYERARHIAYVREAYAAYLISAGALEAARKARAGADIESRDLLRDDPKSRPFVDDRVVRDLLAKITP